MAYGLVRKVSFLCFIMAWTRCRWARNRTGTVLLIKSWGTLSGIFTTFLLLMDKHLLFVQMWTWLLVFPRANYIIISSQIWYFSVMAWSYTWELALVRYCSKNSVIEKNNPNAQINFERPAINRETIDSIMLACGILEKKKRYRTVPTFGSPKLHHSKDLG